VAVPSLDHRLKFQPFGQALAKLWISFGKVVHHALLDGLICFTQRVNDCQDFGTDFLKNRIFKRTACQRSVKVLNNFGG